MVRESGFDFRQGHTCTIGTGSLELESTIECNVDFLRKRLILGKIK
jgi:hypothetical protein